MMKIKICIFDLDGTLINSLYDLADSMNFALKKNNLPVHEREKYRKMVGSGISVLADRAISPTEKADPEIKEKVLADYNIHYKEHCMDLTRPYDGIEETLSNLEEKGISFAVLSNKPDSFSKLIVKTLLPNNNFSAVWGKKDEFPRKPDPTAVLAMIDELGFTAKDCLYIGDSDIDMITAKNAGFIKCGVSWGFRSIDELKNSGADFIAETPNDIIKLIGELNETDPKN